MSTRRPRHLFAILLMLLACLMLTPTRALADDDYSLDATSIWATVETDGSLDVVEVRAVDLDGSFHGFFWEIDTSAGELGDVDVEIIEAGEVVDNEYIPYTYSADSDDKSEGVWTLEEHSSYTRVDVHYDKYDELAYFYVQYHLDGVVARWSDTGELYWKFVGSRWEKTSSNVACTVYFRGSEGTEVTAGENIRGWLHNASLVGEIEVPSGVVPSWESLTDGDPGTLVIQVPYVRDGDFGEVRAAFPAEWVSDAKARRDARLDTILAEEAGWAEEANQRFERAGFWGNIKKWVLNVLIALSVVMALVGQLVYRKTHKAVFDEKYFRDVPSDDHPAVLHYIHEGSAGAGPDFTASLMRLSDMGVITLEKCVNLKKRIGRSPKEKEDWRLTLVPEKAAQLTDLIDKQTIEFVFDFVGQNARELNDLNDRPENTVRMSDFERMAKKYEEHYETEVEGWKETVKFVVDQRGLDQDEKDDRYMTPVIAVLGINVVVLALGLIDIMFFSERSLEMAGMMGAVGGRLAVLFAVTVASVIVLGFQPDRSNEAIEINAKLDALKRWLKDFTRLDEAVPTDVVLWNRLLVMAVILGVSDKVIEQLRVAAPQVMDDTMMVNSVMWCDPALGNHSPVESFNSGFSSAASASGSGGGASGGGGGGGGGGGAY